ncbi:phosphoribosyltransferase [Caballeronia sp. LZ035]|uniref:phosphoribosyltransferase n=1 Tax=Caballeronia sp. LZ035 TaxID=3038568 RepID=UPI002865C073|nr:phosphoribosyltransferase [Caballeronia sp. LZ035]MDR5763135.1 phosphoribosyltransferase [Caballeronia sp. LZ035]
MSLKLLLVSVGGTLAHGNQINGKIAAELGRLVRELDARGVRTVLWSNRNWTVGGVPLRQYFSQIAGIDVPVHGAGVDRSPARVLQNSAAPILQRYGVQTHETVLVGGMTDDMRAGVQNQFILVRPDWYAQQMEYGFPVASVGELARFCFVFALRQHPIFWRVQHGNLDVSAGGPFSTMNERFAVFGGDARAFAKHGQGHPDFWFYFTVSSLYFAGLLQGVDYICSYPGHKPDSDPDIHGVSATLARLGKCFGKSYYHDLIIRHREAPKSQYTKAADRRFITQLNTIHLQPKPHRNLRDQPNKTNLKLAGKRVLVVDDFCTSGCSSEAARAFIEAAGGQARLYSWLKTINTAYQEITPSIDLNAYAAASLAADPPAVAHAYHAGIIDHHAPAEIQSIFDQFCGWTW